MINAWNNFWGGIASLFGAFANVTKTLEEGSKVGLMYCDKELKELEAQIKAGE